MNPKIEILNTEGNEFTSKKNILGSLFYGYVALMCILLVLPAYPIFLLLFKQGKLESALKLRKFYCSLILKFSFLKIRALERYSIQKLSDKPFIFCANHASYLDIAVLVTLLPLKSVFIGKAELLKVPILNLFFTYLDIPVEREDAKSSAVTLIKTIRKLKEGYHLIIFPEGGIFPSAPGLSPFKEGAFVIAQKTKTEIIPISLLNTWEKFPDSKNQAFPGKVKLIVNPPISMDNAALLSKKCYEQIENDLEEYFKVSS